MPYASSVRSCHYAYALCFLRSLMSQCLMFLCSVRVAMSYIPPFACIPMLYVPLFYCIPMSCVSLFASIPMSCVAMRQSFGYVNFQSNGILTFTSSRCWPHTFCTILQYFLFRLLNVMCWIWGSALYIAFVPMLYVPLFYCIPMSCVSLFASIPMSCVATSCVPVFFPVIPRLPGIIYWHSMILSGYSEFISLCWNLPQNGIATRAIIWTQYIGIQANGEI
jgi:hypothetical protein